MRGKRFFRKTFGALFVSAVTMLSPVGASALTQEQLEMFAQNNILFYDPSGSECYSGNLSGNTIMAKVVNYLKGDNPTGFVLSDNGIAGVLANFQAESAFNPFRFQGDNIDGPGYGIAQFDPMTKITDRLMSDSRTSSYFNQYFDLKYSYYDAETGFPSESVPMAVIDAWLSVQMDFFFGASSEFENTKVGSYRNAGGEMGLDYISDRMTVHEALDTARSPEDAVRIFTWIMERPSDKEGGANSRSQNAQKWYSYARSISGGSELGNSSSSNGGNVTIIGDSITVGSEAEIKKLLPQADIYAQMSKQFYEGGSDNPGGITILRELVENNSLRNVLIYALGTNSSGITEAQVDEVVRLAGGSKKIVFVTNYKVDNEYIGNNNNFSRAKNNNSNVAIADWKAAVEGQPSEYLGSDGVHPNSEGQKLFASIISNTINDADAAKSICGGSVNGGLNASQAQRLSDYYNSSNVSVEEWGLASKTKKNCVSFSQWFARYFTGLGWVSGNGKDVAHNFAVKHGLEEGNDPRPYAMFSTTVGNAECPEGSGVKCGHTGIVVTVNNDKVTTIEAWWGSNDSGGLSSVRDRDVNYFVNSSYGYTFTYLDSIIDKTKLSEIVGN